MRDLAAADSIRLADAITRLHDGLRRYWSQGDYWGAGGVVSSLASVAAGMGDDERAARLFGGADALLDKMGAFLPPTDLELYRATAGELRVRMGAAYEQRYRAGQAAPSEEIVAEALTRVPAPRDVETDPADGPVAAVQRLTNRQLAIVGDLVAGLDVQAIARKRQRSPSAVYEILERICVRLNLSTWGEIAPFALKTGLLENQSSKTRNVRGAS